MRPGFVGLKKLSGGIMPSAARKNWGDNLEDSLPRPAGPSRPIR
jgi:hypothetical protein